MNEDELRERLDNLFVQGSRVFGSVDNVFKATSNVFQQITALSKRLERIERLLVLAGIKEPAGAVYGRSLVKDLLERVEQKPDPLEGARGR